MHQPSAVSLPVYPETVSHHLRQWTRWMRASTIRTFWRLRYLPVFSYGWLYVVYTLRAFFTSVAITIVIPLAWPATRNLAIASGIATCARQHWVTREKVEVKIHEDQFTKELAA